MNLYIGVISCPRIRYWHFEKAYEYLCNLSHFWKTVEVRALFIPSLMQVTIGSLELQANHMIQQAFEFLTEDGKYDQLCRLLEREMDGSRVLVFCETKRGCDEVTRKLRQEGWPALSIHGDKSQEERDWVLAVSHKRLIWCV